MRPRRTVPGVKEYRADLLVVGGGLGGCAAAWAALRRGLQVVMTESTDWIGGQLTAQAVPPDEHPWIEEFGCTRSYRRLREEVRRYYRRYYPLTPEARQAAALNPGNAFVSTLAHEPRVSLAVLEAFLAPYRSSGRLLLFLECEPAAASVEGDRVEAVSFRGAQPVTVTAPWIIDASELGELLPLAGVEHVTGSESREETGEPHASEEARPANVQAMSWCFVVDYRPGEDHTIERPACYDFWRDYVPRVTPPWGGRLLSWSATHPVTLQPVVRTFDPENPQPERGPMDLWTFRRIADRSNFLPGTYPSDLVLVNWPQIDYMEGSLLEDPERHREGARQLSLSFLYWMQTEGGWPGLRLRGDVVGTADGLAKHPYVRESRRLRGLFTVREQHVAAAEREVAETFFDSVGVGAYRIDLHPTTGGDNYLDLSALPFQIPLGALIPVRVENLLAGGKNLSVTHITNGCYRLHPVEWNVGEAAGLLCAFCAHRECLPREVREKEDLLEEFQGWLREEGVPLEWPRLGAL